MKRTIYASIVTMMLGLLIHPVVLFAQDDVYGWQLMTEQERAEHRTKMQSMKTKEERERYRYEHHQKMQQRAKQQGVTLPDMPQERMRDRDMNRSFDGGGGGAMGGQGGGGRR